MQTRLRIRSQDPLEEEPRPSLVTELLFPLPAHRRTVLGILTWWESRRLVYNVIVGSAGLITLAVLGIADLIGPAGTGAPGPSIDVGLGFPILAYGILANICFTIGPVVEATLEHVWKDRILPIGPALFRQGIAFSIGLTLLPIPLVIVGEVLRVVRALFGWRGL